MLKTLQGKKKKKKDREAKNRYGKTAAALLISERDSELENIMKKEREWVDTAISNAGAYHETGDSDIRARQEMFKALCQQAQERERIRLFKKLNHWQRREIWFKRNSKMRS
jgi:hypothetical protein